MGKYLLVTPIRGLSPLLQEWADQTSGMSAVRLYEGANCLICGAVGTTCMNNHGPVDSTVTGQVPIEDTPEPVKTQPPGDENVTGYTPTVAQPEFQE